MAIILHLCSNNMILFILWVFFMLSICVNSNPNWINHGGDLYNQRNAYGEKKIRPMSASKLRLKWEFKAGKDITATPAIYGGILYFPSWNGNIYAVRADDGVLVWKKSMEELTGISGTFNASSSPNVTSIVARATPSVVSDRDMVIVGVYGPSLALALKRSNGDLIWKTKLDDHPLSVVTMSGTYYKGAFYVGTSSLEEGVEINECCYFRGSFLKLDVKTGKILWKTFMLPENGGKRGGYSGAAVWGSSPSIDSRRNHVYIATGNLYSVPKHIEECQEEQNQQNHTRPTQPDPCIEPENHSDSILALDLDSGEIEWYKQLGGYDVWFVACANSTNPNCPIGPSPDYDFGEAPMMLTVVANGRKKVDIVAAVQKSGIAWALKRDNGKLFWTTEAGPGGTGGGGIWGSATDKKRVYTGIANSGNLNYTLYPLKNVTTGGGWVAMDAKTGKILWTTAVPNNGRSNPVTIANGVMLAGSTSPRGPIYAIEAKTGKILWSNETGATVAGGMSVSNGCFYVGHGYRSGIGVFNPNNTAGTSLFAYCVC
ncbi:polyvinylalcohol dehydrogenase [Capsicum annuum]|uniref:polyvinylalcohol dehydrogenase n=1 Tax=Capsicum annuum TaxID=4072 RepID=UPI0007BF8DF3|nr:polyvinylalcohol dehydrogenase [Capsicum annuum]